MTHISISKHGSKVWYRCEGHSGYADKGKDIVCAAISILSHSYATLIEDLDRHKQIKVNRFIAMDGLTDIIVEDENNVLKNVIKMQVLGFSSLEEQFSSNLHLEWGEIKK